jgi:hypothetical protein
MGLTIHYQMKLKCGTRQARELVRRMRDFAASLPFDSVTEVIEVDAPDGRPAFAEPGEGDVPWQTGDMFIVRRRSDGEEECVTVPSRHVIAFTCCVEGSEPAVFGLASYPPVVVHREEVVVIEDDGIPTTYVGRGDAIEFPTGLEGFYGWGGFCKTQFASNPKLGGEANFLKAHVSIVRMLDECRRLGMEVTVHDESKYWDHREEKKLLEELKKWDEMMAGFAGHLCDALEPQGMPVVAPIKDRPDFEHLEARGAERLKQFFNPHEGENE